MNEYINMINLKKKSNGKATKVGSHCWGRQGLGGTELQSKAVKSEASKLKTAGKLQYKTKTKIIKIINK